MNLQVKRIFDFLNNGFQEVRSSLDLSFEDDAVADEKIPFLAYLASILNESSFCTYEPPAGSKHFRNLIAGFMKTYHRIPLSADVRKEYLLYKLPMLFPFIYIYIQRGILLSFPDVVARMLLSFLQERWLLRTLYDCFHLVLQLLMKI